MASTLVRLYGVGKIYQPHRYALRDVSFDLSKGEFVYVTGVSGAGKSTLLKLLYAIEMATEGSLFVNNLDVANIQKRRLFQYRRDIGFIFQDFKLLPDLTVGQNVSLPLDIKKMPKDEIEHRVNGVLNLVGLIDRKDEYPGHLSGGEQQRVAIARSIVAKPQLLLADEPTGNLDSRTAREIIALFKEIQEMGTTVLIATHDESLMQAYPARTIELENGMLVSDRGGRD